MGESRRKRQGAVIQGGGEAERLQVVDTLGGRMHVGWDAGAAATPHGQLVRRIAGRSTREQRDEKHSALVAERVANKALREVIATLKEDVDKLASINMTLAAQIGVLKAVAASKVVQISRPGSAHE